MLTRTKISLQPSGFEEQLERYRKEGKISELLIGVLILLIRMKMINDPAKRRSFEKEPAFTDLPEITPEIRKAVSEYTDGGRFLFGGKGYQLCEVLDILHPGRWRLQIYCIGYANCRIRTFKARTAAKGQDTN